MYIMADLGDASTQAGANHHMLASIRAYPDGSFDMRPGFSTPGLKYRFDDAAGGVWEYTLTNVAGGDAPSLERRADRLQKVCGGAWGCFMMVVAGHGAVLLLLRSLLTRCDEPGAFGSAATAAAAASASASALGWQQQQPPCLVCRLTGEALLLCSQAVVERADELRRNARRADFAPAPADPSSFRLVLLADIQAACGFDRDRQYVEFLVSYDPSQWELTGGAQAGMQGAPAEPGVVKGVTHVSKMVRYPPDQSSGQPADWVAHFSHPLELEWLCTAGAQAAIQWPILMFQVCVPHAPGPRAPASCLCALQRCCDRCDAPAIARCGAAATTRPARLSTRAHPPPHALTPRMRPHSPRILSHRRRPPARRCAPTTWSPATRWRVMAG